MFLIRKVNFSIIGCLFTGISLANTNYYNAPIDNDCSNPQIIKLTEKAKAEINARMYLTLATVDENSAPWNAPVYAAFDKKYHFYWMSSLTSQHSKNIRFNNKTFSIIYNSTVPEGTGFGVYLRGESFELDSSNIDKINHGIAVMEARVHSIDRPPASDYLPPNPRRVYEFIPRQIWVNIVVSEYGKNIDKRLDITQCILSKS